MPLQFLKGTAKCLSLCVVLLNTVYYVIGIYKILYKHTSKFPLFAVSFMCKLPVYGHIYANIID